jgi:thiol:disulfide interchange protein
MAICEMLSERVYHVCSYRGIKLLLIAEKKDNRELAACLYRTITCFLLLFSFASGQKALQPPSLDVTAVSSKGAYAPGDTVVVALRVTVPDKYHLYGNPLGPGIGKPLAVSAEGGDAVRWLDVIKTAPKKYTPSIGGWVWAYEKEAIFFLRGIAGAPGVVQGKSVVDALICFTACYPVTQTVPFTLRIDPSAAPEKHFASDRQLSSVFVGCTETMQLKTPQVPVMGKLSGINFADQLTIKKQTTTSWNYKPQEDKPDFNLWLAIIFGFIAGIILNAMPCVLPVLGIKVLSFAQGQGRGRKSAVLHSLSFAAGVMSIFMLLAALAAFADFSWGKHFQDPRALVAIIALIVVFALGMFDAYLIVVPPLLANPDRQRGAGIGSDFFKGVFATILATPCSGPFLGAVLAWSVTQPAIVVFTVYGSIGAGMAFPYVLLSSSERFARLLPKPGRWMQDFKGLMGFLLLGFAAYLMIGLPDDMVVPALLFYLILSLAVVLYGRYAPFGSPVARNVAVFFVALMVAGAGYYCAFRIVYPAFSDKKVAETEAHDTIWRPFSPDSLVAAHTAGRPVMVDFTANWCMNCQYNYLMVLTRREVVDLIKKKNVLALKADLTVPNPVADSLLHRLGSQSIPFLALFPGDQPHKPIVFRDVLTKGKILRALNQLNNH